MMSYPYRSIESYLHKNQIGVLVEFGMYSEFTMSVPEVRTFMKDIAVHIAACSPKDIKNLMSQGYAKDPDKQVRSLLAELREYVSEEVAILRFVRWQVGEEDDDDSPDPPRSPANVIRMRGLK